MRRRFYHIAQLKLPVPSVSDIARSEHFYTDHGCHSRQTSPDVESINGALRAGGALLQTTDNPDG
jgi:hypothetical protein